MFRECSVGKNGGKIATSTLPEHYRNTTLFFVSDTHHGARTNVDRTVVWCEAFISTSDSHYRQLDHKLGRHNDLNRASIEEINKITTVASRV
jgi:hypothetical protein